MALDSSQKSSNLFAKTCQAFDKLEFREQRLIFLLTPVTVIIVAFLLFIEPELKAVKAVEQKIIDLQLKQEMADASISELLAEASKDPNESIKKQIENLQQKLKAIDSSFDEQLSQLVLPASMPILMQQLFDQAKNTRVVSVNSIAPIELFVDLQNDLSQRSKSDKIYKHGIELVFEANFFETRDFLQAAEQLGWKIYWQELSFKVSQHPISVTKISLFTLSTSEVFISVE